MNETRRVSWPWIALGALGLAFSLWLHLRLGDMGFDDTWIHLRIARNLLATGHAWFNTNERVMATSSPLWTLLMAALHVTARPSVLPVLEALLFWGACVLAFSIARRHFALQSEAVCSAAGALAAVCTGALLLPSSVGQMETPLAMVLLLASWRAAQAGLGLALPVLAMAAVARLELLPVWFVATLVTLLWSRRHRVAALESLCIVLLMAGWTLAQFHVLLPNSMRAKQISYDFTLAQTAKQFVGFRVRDGVEVLLLCVLVAITISLFWRSRATRPAWQNLLPPAAVLSGILIVVEYIARRTVLFDWYRPLYLLPLALGVLLLLPDTAWFGASTRLAFATAQCVLLGWLLAPAARALPRYLRGAITPTVAQKSWIDGGDYVRVQEYLQVGRVLQQTCPDARVLASEIGGLGWSFPGELLDGFGIASPAALRFQPLRNGSPKGGIPAAFALQAAPDIIVSYTVMADQLFYTPEIAQRYSLVLLPTTPRDHRGGLLDIAWRSSTHLNVWLRRNGACNSAAVATALHAQID
ncbi:hypothetical protein [Terriglobus aquaticus]|uniref:Glycosyltransferase RgtA/B/C/D-like domain-containing protein n=1 Tax=Terriglobus aquaticus TaxID=940139 RepID=A0ABW9KNE2_9BACT|nr:hypothetical protein [Terriglobus aquaticus]